MSGAPSKSREFLKVLPVAGIMCLLGAFGWAIWGAMEYGYLIPGAAMLGGLGILFFLTTFIGGEIANLKYYLRVGVYTVFVLGTVVVIYLGVRLHDRRFDLTPQKRHTLSEQTRRYLPLLRKEVEVVVFDTDRRPYEDLLSRYAALTPLFKWSIRDPSKDPEFTRKFDPVVANKTIYVTHDKKRKRMPGDEFSESLLTNAIVEVTRETSVNVYFLQGQGEWLLTRPVGRAAAASDSVSFFRSYLASQSMVTQPLDLSQTGFVPNDASLVILAGLLRDFTEAEARPLESYLGRGGKLLLFLDIPPVESEKIEFTRLDEVLRRRGIADTPNVIVDMLGWQQEGNYLKIPLKTYNTQHKITERLAQLQSPLTIPIVRSIVSIQPAPKDLTVTPLVASGNQAWTENWAESQSRPLSVPDKDKMGQQAIGWAVEGKDRKKTPMRIAVYGSSAFVQDRTYAVNQTAREIAQNSVNWLIEQEDLIAVPPRTIAGTPLILTNAQMQLILILVGLALPATIFFGGVSYARLVRRG